MGLLNWIVDILAISFLPLVARVKAIPPAIVILCSLLSCIFVGLILLYHRYKLRCHLQLHMQRWNLHAHQVNDSVYELHRPDSDPMMQIVFFHGLPLEDFSVAHLSSWESEDGSCLWPKTWLAEEVADAHILAVSYNEGLRKESVERLDMRIIAETLISDLIDASIGQRLYCPVVLVGHSFGGLVIKNLCVEGHHMLHSNINGDRIKKFLGNVKGIFYYGTPHHGSPDISKARHILGSPLLKYFTTLSTVTERLNHDFDHLPGKWQTKGIGEGQPVKSGLFRGVIVVPEAAARGGDSFNVDHQADHFSINKPDKKISGRFTALKGLLHDIAHNLKEEIKLRDAKTLEKAWPQNVQRLPQHMKGLDFRLDEVKAKLKKCQKLGFVGMGGLGKTTLAKAVFNELASTFQYTCFVHEVKSITGTEKELKKVVWKDVHCDGKEAGEKEQWFKLREQKVLVVFDDISTDRDVEVLLDISNDTSPESRFIVTSRDHALLKGLDGVYEIPFLDESSSKELFVSHAFPNQVHPDQTLATNMEAIVKKCGGLPLTLEVLGKFLKTKDDDKYWKQTLEALDKAEEVTDLNTRLWAKLRPSYEDLGEKEQQMFLDAGTFFSNHGRGRRDHKWTLREALAAWSEVYETTSVWPLWQTLVDRSLVYDRTEDEEIQMHEQLGSLGRKIAAESHHNNKPRVWERTEALRLLQATHHTDNKEFHAFRLCADDSNDRVHIAGATLHKLKKVQFLELDNSVVIDGAVAVESFPSRVVSLTCAGLKIFNPDLQSHLVILKLELGEHLLPKSIRKLSTLRVLILTNAIRQDNMPDEIGHLSKLEHLELDWCYSLRSFPETFGKLINLKYLILKNCDRLHALPESFGDLMSLKHLEFNRCAHLEALPASFGNLSALEHLEVDGCYCLQSLPETFGKLFNLKFLRLRYCGKLQALPECFGDLMSLEYLKFQKCVDLEALPESFGNLSALKTLYLWDCGRLEALPESFGDLSALNTLYFYSCRRLEALPESFGNLSALKTLDLLDCGRLEALPESFKSLSALQHLVFNYCAALHSLPKFFGDLSALQYLDFHYCHKLHTLPESFGHLAKLHYLRISGMPSLLEIDKLHKSLAELMAVNHLILDFISVESIPDCIKSMESLHILELGRLPFVKQLPAWLGTSGTAPLALSYQTFRKQDGHFTLAEVQTARWTDFNKSALLRLVTTRVMKKVRASDYEGALADFCCINLGVLETTEDVFKGFFLQERGIAKRFVGNLKGALEDLTAALGAFSGGNHLNHYAYDCWKQRGFVNSLLSDVEGAEKDGAMALKVLSKYGCQSVISPCLGEESVMYMHFNLKSASKINEEEDSSHSQVMDKVRASDFHGALAIWEDFSASVSGYHDQAFFLQERGIIKRLSGDLQGASEDLTTALEIYDYDSYDCFKNRGYVKYLMGDMDGAQNDGVMALKLVDQRRGYTLKSGSLADDLVTFMHFRLKGRTEIEEETRSSPHFQVMEKVRELKFLEALAIWEAFDARVSGHYDQVLFLQETGILKRLVGDLHGALQDLNSASAMDPDDYEVSKHRGYVKYLLGDIDGARMDAERCLAMGIKEASDNCLGAQSVTFLEFIL